MYYWSFEDGEIHFWKSVHNQDWGLNKLQGKAKMNGDPQNRKKSEFILTK